MHESFLSIGNYRYAKYAIVLVIASLLFYFAYLPLDTTKSFELNYLLGSLSFTLLFFMMWIGIRKRQYGRRLGRLTAWVSAHVYFGLALLVICTLHSKFAFAWNVHTIAYFLLVLDIGIGMVGAIAYRRYPTRLTANLRGESRSQLVMHIRGIDEQMKVIAKHAGEKTHRIISRTLPEIGTHNRFIRRLFSKREKNRSVVKNLITATENSKRDDKSIQWLNEFINLLAIKEHLQRTLDKDTHYTKLVNFWIYIHVPLSFAVLAAVIIHVLTVFMY